VDSVCFDFHGELSDGGLCAEVSLIQSKVEVMRLRQLKIIVEIHPVGLVAYPLGLKGVVVGEGDAYEAALEDVKSAFEFYLEMFLREIKKSVYNG